MSDSPPNAEREASTEPQPKVREVRFEYSRDFPRILQHLNASLLISTYQAGKLGVIGMRQGELKFGWVALKMGATGSAH
jgi:hypothetical protein